jgi:hypothetical protein
MPKGKGSDRLTSELNSHTTGRPEGLGIPAARQDSEEDETPEAAEGKPYPLLHLKYPNSGVVLEDNTMVVSVSFKLARMWKKHKLQLEIRSRDV